MLVALPSRLIGDQSWMPHTAPKKSDYTAYNAPGNADVKLLDNTRSYVVYAIRIYLF